MDQRNLASASLVIGLPAPDLDADTAAAVRELDPAGVILFKRNLVSYEQIRDLISDLRRHLREAHLFAIDQEGGRVSRLEDLIGPTPSALALARAGGATAREFGATTARALRCLGFNLDFAPVVDLSAPEAPNGIGDRAFSQDAETVARMAGAFLYGLQSHGVAGCLKHFPGLGRTSVDSHEVLPTVSRSRAKLQAEDLLPYRRMLGTAASIMVAHGHYPALDGPNPRPASCSPAIVTRLLREQLGYAGLIVSDDLEMGAVADRDRNGAAAVEALSAGCDLLLYCADLNRARAAIAAVERECERSAGFRARLEQAARRVAAFARRWSLAPRTDPTEWARAVERFARYRRLT